MKQAYTKYFSHFVGVLATFRQVDVIFTILATLLSILRVSWVYFSHFAVGGTFELILRGFGSFGVLSGSKLTKNSDYIKKLPKIHKIAKIDQICMIIKEDINKKHQNTFLSFSIIESRPPNQILIYSIQIRPISSTYSGFHNSSPH